MKVLLLDPDETVRSELEALLRRSGIGVAPFSDRRTAFLFLLARLDELDGVLVNDDHDGSWSGWLRHRLGILSAPLPVASYSGLDPERAATIGSFDPGGAADSIDSFRSGTRT